MTSRPDGVLLASPRPGLAIKTLYILPYGVELIIPRTLNTRSSCLPPMLILPGASKMVCDQGCAALIGRIVI